MFKLIKSGTPVIHHYTANSQYWGHSMQGFKTGDNVEFEKLTTYKVSGSCFSEIPLFSGDFISRSMQSGKIGLFEIQIAGRPTGGSWPNDFYNFNAVFCGYLVGNNILIHPGYGIPEPKMLPIKRFISMIFKSNKEK